MSGTEFILNTGSMEQFGSGISYTGDDDLIITIEDTVTIRSTGSAGILSAAPVIIRSPAGHTLAIIVDSDEEIVSGISAPSLSIESGRIDITVTGENDSEKGNAFGIRAGSGNVTITGGTVSTTVATTCHKNKGIYASRFITVSGGQVTADQHGGMNTFGLDGGDVETGNTDGGIRISGGTIIVNSSGGATRNIGIDSKFGTVTISGDPVIIISEDESGARQNFAFNANITSMSGNDAVIFTSEGGSSFSARAKRSLDMPLSPL